MAYIDKDLLLKDIEESVVFSVRDGVPSPELRGARKIIDRIENAPTADVQKAKHGYWKTVPMFDEPDCDYLSFECSCCGNLDVCEENYCSECGAKMGGKEE